MNIQNEFSVNTFVHSVGGHSPLCKYTCTKNVVANVGGVNLTNTSGRQIVHGHAPTATTLIHLYPHRLHSPLQARSPWWAESPPAAEISQPRHIFLPKKRQQPDSAVISSLWYPLILAVSGANLMFQKARCYLHQFPLVQLVGSCSASMCQHTALDRRRGARERKVRARWQGAALKSDVSQKHSTEISIYMDRVRVG